MARNSTRNAGRVVVFLLALAAFLAVVVWFVVSRSDLAPTPETPEVRLNLPEPKLPDGERLPDAPVAPPTVG